MPGVDAERPVAEMVQMLSWWQQPFVVLLEGLPMGQLLRVALGLFDPSVAVAIEFAFEDVTAMMGPGHLDQGLTLDVTGTNAFKMICRPDPRWPRQCRQPR